MKKATLKITKNDMLELVVSKPLNESESDFVRARIPGLKRLVKCDYSGYPDGWQIDPALPERAFLVRNGGLVDSCIFESAEQARSFIRRLKRGESPHVAMSASMQS